MTFYRILGDWDEMGPPGDPDIDDEETRAYQQVRRRFVIMRVLGAGVGAGSRPASVREQASQSCWLKLRASDDERARY